MMQVIHEKYHLKRRSHRLRRAWGLLPWSAAQVRYRQDANL